MLGRLVRAENQSQRRLFARLAIVLFQPVQVEFRQRLFRRLDLSQLQIDGNRPVEAGMVEEW